ncbi:MAG TPA: methyl-accepting chemotaxis protein, partial [Ferrovibrio sp.]
VAEIAAASREQAGGLEQVNTAVGSMDEMTQRNGALVEQTSASAQSLADQGRQLADLVAFFKLEQNVKAPASPAASAAATGKPAAKPQPEAAKPAAQPVTAQPAAAKPAAAKPIAAKPAAAKPIAAKAAAKPAAAEPAQVRARPSIPAAAAADDDDWKEF